MIPPTIHSQWFHNSISPSLSLSFSQSLFHPSMEKPNFNPETPTPSPSSTLQVLSPGSSGRRSSASNSSEFEFWMVRNPSFPQPQLLSADELFVDGVLLPLHLLPHQSDPPDPEEQHKADSETPNPEPESEPGPGPESSTMLLPELTTGFSTSKRWRDIFKLGEKRTKSRTSSAGGEDRDKEKKKERKSGGGGGGGASGAELNINLWPFSRSRSAGNSVNRPKLAAAAATRKVSSAPCSRSNSAGESKSRRWPSSPGRVGVHIGRTNPVWQIRRGGSGVRSSNLTEPVGLRNVDKEGASRSSERVVKTADKGRKKDTKETRRNKKNVVGGGGGGGGGGGSRTRVLYLNVPMCIGYRQHLSCRSDENGTIGDGGVGGGSDSQSSGATGNSGSGSSLLNLRTIFSKKVY